MKMVYQNLGTVWGIGVYADSPEELELQYNSLWNHGATNASMIKECDTFGYVLVQPEPEEKMLRYFVNSEFHKLMNIADELEKQDYDCWKESVKGLKGGVMPQAKINAQKRMSELMDNHEKWISQSSSNNFYNLGTIGGFSPTYC